MWVGCGMLSFVSSVEWKVSTGQSAVMLCGWEYREVFMNAHGGR